MNVCRVLERQLSNDLSHVKRVLKANNCRSFTKSRWYTIQMIGPELAAFIARLGKLFCIILIQPLKVASFTSTLIFFRLVKPLNVLDHKIAGPAALLLNSEKTVKLFLGCVSTTLIGTFISPKTNVLIHSSLRLLQIEPRLPKNAGNQHLNFIDESSPLPNEPENESNQTNNGEKWDNVFDHLTDVIGNEESSSSSLNGILQSNSTSVSDWPNIASPSPSLQTPVQSLSLDSDESGDDAPRPEDLADLLNNPMYKINDSSERSQPSSPDSQQSSNLCKSPSSISFVQTKDSTPRRRNSFDERFYQPQPKSPIIEKAALSPCTSPAAKTLAPPKITLLKEITSPSLIRFATRQPTPKQTNSQNGKASNSVSENGSSINRYDTSQLNSPDARQALSAYSSPNKRGRSTSMIEMKKFPLSNSQMGCRSEPGYLEASEYTDLFD